MVKKSATRVSTTRSVTVKLVPDSPDGNMAQHRQDDSCTYAIAVQAVDAKSPYKYEVALAATAGSGENGLKYHPADKLPAQADCYLQLWELDRWHPDGTTKKFDQLYPEPYEEDENAADAKNRLIGTLSGALTRDENGRWKFVCLDDSGLPEAKSAEESSLPLRVDKAGGAAAVKKVAVGVENESRWELGLHLTADANEKKWESIAFDGPICFVESMRNLVRMQLAEGGLAIACYSDLNLGGSVEPILQSYKTELKKVQDAIETARSKVHDAVAKALQDAAAARATTNAAPLPANVVADFGKEQEKALVAQGDQLKGAVKAHSSEQSKENYDAWRTRVIGLLQQAGPSAKQTFLAKVQSKYGLSAAQAEAIQVSFYENLPAPAEVPDATTKTFYDVQNDREFGSEAKTVAREFGFITVENGAVTKGAHGVQDPASWVQHVEDVVATVKSAYPEVCAGKDPKVYRLAILTHGAVTWGLKFPNPPATSEDPKKCWFTAEKLAQPDGQQFFDRLAKQLAPQPVVALYACNTGGNDPPLKVRENRLLAAKLAPIKQKTAETVKKLGKSASAAKTQKEKLTAQEKIANARLEGARECQRAADEERATWPKTTYELHLASYGGVFTADATSVKNVHGKGSFADKFRAELLERGIRADVWGHTDAGHTSRNARLRLFRSDGTESDLVRLVFENSDEFKSGGTQPSERQLSWWWNRGDERADLAHQKAVKKAALCSAASLDDEHRAFSLKTLIGRFRGWYPG